MADDKPEGAVSYEGGVEKKIPVVLGEMAKDETQAAERARVYHLKERVKQYIREDRDEVWEELRSRQEALVRRAQRHPESITAQMGVLPDAVAAVATEMFEMWIERDDRDVAGLELVQGVCIQHPHAWFQIEADPMLVADLKYIYLIDPAPRGLELEAPYLVIPPLSPFQQAYAGKPMGRAE